MKKLFLLLFLIMFFTPLKTLAEDITINLNSDMTYIILLDKKIIKTEVENKRLLKSEVVTNIFNEKNQVLLTTMNEGKTKMLLSTGSKLYTLKININNNTSFSTPKIDGISIIEFDVPPQKDFILDKPPMLKDSK